MKILVEIINLTKQIKLYLSWRKLERVMLGFRERKEELGIYINEIAYNCFTDRYKRSTEIQMAVFGNDFFFKNRDELKYLWFNGQRQKVSDKIQKISFNKVLKITIKSRPFNFQSILN